MLGRVLTVGADGVPSNADRGNQLSVAIAAHVVEALHLETIDERRAGQTLGGRFEQAVAGFVEQTFLRLDMLRPGAWSVLNIGSSRASNRLSAYEPYRHLAELDEALSRDPSIRTVIGNAYMISPDILVVRQPESDQSINCLDWLVDHSFAQHSPIRMDSPSGSAMLHAVISCKWTMRSDRAQNARSEALNLIRNRKGRAPHIAVVTAEPLPSRISSLALGTGDIDCVYHFALNELVAAVSDLGSDDSRELLQIMIEGQRLKDISDLPLDLTI
ncbi:NgoMIV family type II restriction endonuclease [Aestuariimicrobium sp. p3-SID1156]|uniref:NgoMIV family type II restriction endonuclease n=1 Tax=Aestuariimicrobium sp. p3-SID1156 TaxID=2916038 RepID=UPI00223AFBAD|nr:NgoMIV family type II restriction endonuclease [Aestuariimicrobium sp. p3-SID1156]MCT1458638.1 NgoMIV family type II restriction endonuclease [Aestuariimicrobium sp. p3-SID1156]